MKFKPNYFSYFSIVLAIVYAFVAHYDQHSNSQIATWIFVAAAYAIGGFFFVRFFRSMRKAESERSAPTIPFRSIPTRVIAKLPLQDDWTAKVERWAAQNGYLQNTATSAPDSVFFQKHEGLYARFAIAIRSTGSELELKCWFDQSQNQERQLDDMPPLSGGARRRKAEISNLAADFGVTNLFGGAKIGTPYGLTERNPELVRAQRYYLFFGAICFIQLIAMLGILKWAREAAPIGLYLRIGVSFLLASLSAPLFIFYRMTKDPKIRNRRMIDGCGISVMCVLFSFATFGMAPWSTLELDKLMYISVAPGMAIAVGLFKLLKPFYKPLSSLFSAIILAACAIGLVWALNITFDFSSPKEMVIGKLGKFVSDKGYSPRFEVDFAPWIKTTQTEYIRAEKFSHLNDGESISAVVHDGLFGIKWFGGSFPTRYSSVDLLLASLKSEQELLRSDIDIIWRRSASSSEQSKKYTDLTDKWKTRCKSEGGYSCRLASYFVADKTEMLKLLKKGCEGSDQHSCFNLFLYQALSDKEKSDLVAKAKADCESGTMPQCFYYGQYLATDKKSAKDAIPYLHKACEVNYLNACVTEKQLKDI